MSGPTFDEVRAKIEDTIHRAEMDEWPKVSADPQGGCLGRDRCAFVASAVLVAIRPIIGKLIGDAQASEGDLMRDAGYRAGYEAGKKYQLDLERWCA